MNESNSLFVQGVNEQSSNDRSIVTNFLRFLEDKIEPDEWHKLSQDEIIQEIPSKLPEYGNSLFRGVVDYISKKFNWPVILILKEYNHYYTNCTQ